MSHSPDMIWRRPRRLRSSAGVRAMVRETQLTADDLIAPLFIHDRGTEVETVPSMPGVVRHSVRSALQECRELADLGVRAVALFPCLEPDRKDALGQEALNPDTLLLRAVRAVKSSVEGLEVITDVALDPYTSHGHDGVLDEDSGDVDNDRTVEILAKMAVLHAQAGADWVAPSDMMDGRVRAIRHALDASGHTGTIILAYSAKFASAYYGPFRDAIGSGAPVGKAYLDKRSYQLNSPNRREAILDALLDEEEGADILMVKPAGPYLDILRDLRERTLLPLAAYQVSGEYAQIHAAAERGWLDLERTRDESLLAIKRAGADMILTYFARTMAESLAR